MGRRNKRQQHKKVSTNLLTGLQLAGELAGHSAYQKAIYHVLGQGRGIRQASEAEIVRMLDLLGIDVAGHPLRRQPKKVTRKRYEKRLEFKAKLLAYHAQRREDFERRMKMIRGG